MIDVPLENAICVLCEQIGFSFEVNNTTGQPWPNG